MIKVFESFSGVGSQRIALRNLGIEHEVVAIAEIDKFALQSYEAIHGDCPNLGDISKIDPHDIPDHDLFTYSFPCQDISVAGKQAGVLRGQTRSGLLYECEKVIEAKRPKYLLLENVKNLVGKKHREDFDKWLEYLESLGYTNYWQVLNAKDYGIPQNRERVFVVSILGDHKPYKFPEPVELQLRLKDVLEPAVDEKFYMDKPFKLVDKGHQAEFLAGKFEQNKRIYSEDNPTMRAITLPNHGHNNILVKAEIEGLNNQNKRALDVNGVCTTIDSMQGGHREPKILEVAHTNDAYEQNARVYGAEGICPTIAARDYKDAKKILEPKPVLVGGVGEINFGKQYRQGNRIYDGESVAMCLTAQPVGNAGGNSYLYALETPEQEYRIRKLTPKECWRLMGFTDEDFQKAKDAGVSNSQLYKQAGNSIVVNVLEGIFRNLFVEVENSKTPSEE